MKKLFYFLIVSFIAVGISSCGDDDETAVDAPIVTNPTAVSVQVGTTATVDFAYTAAGGFASSRIASVTGGTAEVTTDGTADATSGTITVTFTAGTTAGAAAAVVLEVTDADGQTDDATVVLTITETPVAPTVSVRGEIEGTVNWTKDNVYILETRVTVVEDATLNIEAGTIVKAASGQGSASTALLVARGGTLNANGTAAAPIIFTSIDDQITPAMVADGNFQSPNLQPSEAGKWGGVIILGAAPISVNNQSDPDERPDIVNIPNNESQIEGIPATDENGRYGGNVADDNSGTIRYISIRHGGTNIGAGNEINGLTLGGVGSGTTIEWVEVVANDDDGVEWFGGTVDVSGVLVWNCNDDALDTDQDWIGTCNNFIVVAPNGGSAFELDGPEGDAAGVSGMANSFTNGIVYAGDNIDHLVDWDGTTNTGVSNVYFYGWSASYTSTSEFDPIETFGGDESGASANWQYTLTSGGASVSDIFTGVPTAALTEVAANANTVGVSDVAGFSWTWASQAGGLSGIGIQ